jgi:MFS family permease
MRIIAGVAGVVCALCAAGVAWFIASRLATDAVAMAIGIVFGVVAALPTAVLLAASRSQAPIEEKPLRRPRLYIYIDGSAQPGATTAGSQAPQPGAGSELATDDDYEWLEGNDQ